MARPFKKGLDYFPLDVHLEDEIELFEAECGLEGFAILIKLWQKIFSEGYYMKWNDDTSLLFSRRINAETELVNSIINVCLRRSLFDKLLYKKHRILTSKAIQKRYFQACSDSKRKNIEASKALLLVNGKYLALIQEFIELPPELTLVNPSESTQRKGKEIERKLNKELINSGVNKNQEFCETIFSFWNDNKIIVHETLNDEFKKDITKALKDSTMENIKTSITRYATMLHDKNYPFCGYKWGIHEFFSRKEGYLRFLDDGSKWLSYISHINKSKLEKGFSQRTYEEKDIEDLYFDPFKETQKQKQKEEEGSSV